MTPTVRTVETPGLGDRSYLAHDGEVAVVIDPQRDFDRMVAVAREEGVRITHVFETHLHNDYVTGGLALARETGADYVVSGEDDVAFDRVPAHDGSEFRTGRLTIKAISTPGHTEHHLAYELSGDGDGDGSTVVFTGGSMLFGAVGRTDLVSPEATDSLTRAQFRSVRRLAAELPPEAEVLPTHGFGSFCSATTTSGDSSTIGKERDTNVALTTSDEDEFVRTLLAGLGAYPRYYAHMGPANAKGPGKPDLSAPEVVDPQELRRRLDAGEWVVDLRARKAFARTHVRGTVSIEIGEPFATYFGWTVPWQAPVTLIGDAAEEVSEAQRQLARIGIDHVAGAATGSVDTLSDGQTASYRVASFEDLAKVVDDAGVVVLDVRRPDEWATQHLHDVANIPFWELAERADEVPPGQVWVHCASGFRASIGASILQRAGHDVVHVDDDWDRAAAAGLRMAE
jgi:hydroxyacylglutathione hydrolase